MTPSRAAKVAESPEGSPGEPAPRLRKPPTPRYYRVYASLQKSIRDGIYRRGSLIPTEHQLCRDFGVSRITIRRALHELQRDGWLTRRSGVGTFVARTLCTQPVAVNWNDVVTSVTDFTSATTVASLTMRVVEADAETREILRLAAGTKVQQVMHVRLLKSEPLGVITNWVPQDIAERVPEPIARRGPLFASLDHTDIQVGDSSQAIGAIVATRSLARTLGVAVGAPLVRIERVVFDRSGRGIERLVALYRADRYQFRMSLTQSAST